VKLKKCNICREEKPRDQFYAINSSKYKDSWDCRDAYCIPCRKNYVNERSWKIKLQCVEYLGGVCIRCGLKTVHIEVYDFHHRDPNEKDLAIGRNRLSFKSLKNELDKCDLLCANCHRIVHYN